MNQVCKVCGEPAAGFHFGAFTCEGCKVSDLFNYRPSLFVFVCYRFMPIENLRLYTRTDFTRVLLANKLELSYKI